MTERKCTQCPRMFKPCQPTHVLCSPRCKRLRKNALNRLRWKTEGDTRRAKWSEYRNANRAKVKVWNRVSYQKHRADRLDKAKRYRLANSEKIKSRKMAEADVLAFLKENHPEILKEFGL